MEIRISKTKLTLELWCDGECLHRFPVGIGRAGAGHKRREGDQLTPVGEYRVCVKNPRSKYYLSLGLDYPSPADAAAALAEGRIDAATHEAIVQAHAAGRIPPWKTPLGGEIYIHGHLEKQAWSDGCLRLKDADMKTLFDLVPVGTRVTIVD